MSGAALATEAADSPSASPAADSSAAALQVPDIEKPVSEPPSAEAESDDSEIELTEMQVQGTAVKNSVTTERRKAPVTVDLLTKQDMSKFIATDVADAIVRMPGLSTTTRGSFAVIRGLAERYNPILLDGIVLPSSDPERQTPELDLFPTRLVDAIVVNKVFDTKLPGTSSGGAVDLRTKPLPEGRFAQIQFGVRADEGAINRDTFQSSDTPGHWDLLALGAKDRPEAPQGASEQIALTKDPATNWAGEFDDFPVGTRFSIAFEDRLDLGGNGRALGYSFSVGYDSSATAEEGRVFGLAGTVSPGSTGIALSDGSLRTDVTGEDYAEYEQKVSIGGIATVGFAFSQDHVVSFSAFLSQIGIENVTRTFNGFNGLNSGTVEQLDLLYQAFDTGVIPPAFQGVTGTETALNLNESIYYRQRNLTDLKLSGEHQWNGAQPIKLDWSVARIKASQEEPDFSYLGYVEYFPLIPGIETYLIQYGQPSRLPTRYWRDVTEDTWAGRLDGEIEFDLGGMRGVLARAGVYFDRTERSFSQDSFYLTGGFPSDGYSLPELVADLQSTGFGVGGRGLGENPAFADAERKLSAGHLSAAFPILEERSWAKKLSLLVGARMERFEFTASGRGTLGNASSADYYITRTVTDKLPTGSLGPVNLPQTVYTRTLDESTLHPLAALTWSPVNRLNVRLAYSQTVARPSFREMGPYFTSDEVTNEAQHGNVFLNTSEVDSYDFRTEYFLPNSRDLVALSLFAKKIQDPIEKSADALTGSGITALGWFNNPNPARMRGVEIEAAKNFKFLGDVGSWFTLGGNATFIDAKVKAGPIESIPPGTERPLFDQPEWIGNVYLTFEQPRAGFSTTISWFGISDVLRNTAYGKWATYVESYDRLDLSVNQRIGQGWLVRFSIKNLTDPERHFVADPSVATDGVTYRTFKDGRSYSLSVTYDF